MASVHTSKSGTKYASQNIGKIERVLGPGQGDGTDGYKIEGGDIFRFVGTRAEIHAILDQVMDELDAAVQKP